MKITLWPGERTTSPTGVDIGAKALRAVRLARTMAGGWQITQATRIELDPGVSPATAGPAEHRSSEKRTQAEGDDSQPAEDDDARGECFRRLRRMQNKTRHIALAMQQPGIEFHALEIPEKLLDQNAAARRQIIEQEAYRLTTYLDGQLEVRYWLLPRGSGNAPNAMGVVARQGHIERATNLAQHTGLTCASIEPAALPLVRLGCALHAWQESDVWGLLDFGQQATRLIICLHDTPVVIRTVGDGGQSWTQRVAEELQISPSAAEVQKCDHGIARSGPGRGNPALGAVVGANIRLTGESGGNGAEAWGQQSGAALAEPTLAVARTQLASLILGALRSDVQRLATQIKRSFEYTLSCYPRCRAAGIVTVGGGACMANLADHLQDVLGISVRSASDYLGDPGCGLTCNLTRRHSLEEFALAVGLAMEA